MKTNTKVIGVVAVCTVIVIAAALFGRMAFAEEPLPRQVAEAVESISKNQKRISELRPFISEFEKIKADNNYLTGRLSVYGYTYDWSRNVVVKTDPSTPPL